MIKPLLLTSAVLATLAYATIFNVAASAKQTQCNYQRITGDPLSAYRVARYMPGHVQCASQLIGPQGLYGLTSQQHL